MLLSIIIAVMSLAAPVLAQDAAAWIHAEYGAGNYGGTALIGDVGIHNLRKRHPDQFRVLYDELDGLVATKGAKGVFYLNDLVAEHALYAAVKLAAYAQVKGYDQVMIRILPGDFTTIDLPVVGSAQLRNPEPNFLVRVSGDLLQRLANSSASGLNLTTYVAERVWNRAADGAPKLGVTVVQEKAPPYIYPDGTAIGPRQYVDGPHSVYNISRKKSLPATDSQTLLGRSFKPGEGCAWILQGVMNEARLIGR